MGTHQDTNQLNVKTKGLKMEKKAKKGKDVKTNKGFKGEIRNPFHVKKWDCGYAVCTGSISMEIKRGLTRGTALRLAGALNREHRAILFKPKSPGRRARTKGHGFEREVAIHLRTVYPGARRHLEYQDSQAIGVDIAETGFFKFQCKRLAKYASITKIEEIEHDPVCGDVPVLVTAADKKLTMAVLPFRDLLWLMKKAGVGK